LDIRSPVDGTVSQLTIHSVNEVVAPGQVIMVVVPTNRQLTVETQILPSSIDQIHLGQSAKVRFTAFSQTTTPAIEGTVTRIAPDVVKDDKTGKTYYPVMIGQNISADGDLAGLALYPGMPAEVFIESENRSVISYLMKPLTDQMQRAMREE
jgi:membrane fusion protein